MAYIAANSPVYSPGVPYKASLVGGLKEGACLVVQGAVQEDANDFRVDFCIGEPHGADTVFVYNPRFNQGEVVRNSCSGGDWGDEEKDGGLPFQQGQSFELKIECTPSSYQVFVNGSYHCEYNHRASYNSVNCINVEGEIDAHEITLHQRARVRASNCPIPFVADYSGGLQYGTVIIVRGRLHPEPNEFRIDLTCGMSDDSDVAFVFNPRFGQGEVVRNHCIGGGWGDEEKEGGFPFSPGEYVDVRIDVHYSEYQVTVNGQSFPSFSHRFQPLECVNTIKVAGDLQLDDVLVH